MLGIVVLHGVGSNNNHCASSSQLSFFVALLQGLGFRYPPLAMQQKR